MIEREKVFLEIDTTTGAIGVRTLFVAVDDAGAELAQIRNERAVFMPGDNLDAAPAIAQMIAAELWTPAAVAAYRAHVEQQLAGTAP